MKISLNYTNDYGTYIYSMLFLQTKAFSIYGGKLKSMHVDN